MKIKITCRCDYEEYYCTEDFILEISEEEDWVKLSNYLNYLSWKVGKILKINYKDESFY